MVKLRTSAKNILNIIAPLKACNSAKVKVKFSEKEIEIKQVDPAHVMMISTLTNVEVAKREGSITEYEVTGYDIGEDFETYGMDIDKLIPLLKQLGNEEVYLHTEFVSKKNRNSPKGESIANTLVIETPNMTRSMYLEDKYGLNEPKAPKLTLPAVFEVSASVLKKRLAYMMASEVSHCLVVTYEAGKVTWRTGPKKNQEDDFVEFVDYVNSVAVKDTRDVTSKYRSLYPLDYMTRVLKYISPTAESGYKITVNMGNDYPLKMEYVRGNTKIQIFQAPRIESD